MDDSRTTWRQAARACALALATIGTLSAAPAGAQPIVFTITGFATGDLNGAPLTNTPFTVALSADVANRTFLAPDTPAYENLTGTVALDGFGVATFSDLLYVFANQSTPSAGFGSAVHGDLVEAIDPAFAAYDLLTSIGPITDFGVSMNPAFTDVATSLGPLTISAVLDVSFQAVTTTPTAIPEPATVTLVAGGLLVVGAAAARRRRGPGA